MKTISNAIEQFLRELNRKPYEEDGIGFGTMEELRQFAFREGLIKEENQEMKN